MNCVSTSTPIQMRRSVEPGRSGFDGGGRRLFMVESRPKHRNARKSVPQDQTARPSAHTHSTHAGPRRPRSRKKFSLIALNLAIVLIVAGGTAAYGALSRTVVLSIDGHHDTIRTFGDNVSDVLKAKHISLRDDDKLNVSPSTKLRDGIHVTV